MLFNNFLLLLLLISPFVQYNTSSFSLSILRTSSSYVIIVLRHFSQATISVKISNFLICYCSFYLSCPTLEKHNFIKKLYIVLCCH